MLLTSAYVRALVGKALHERHARKQDYHEDEGDRRGKVQVVCNVLPLDSVADEEELAVAELLGNVEGADRRDEHHGDAGDDARQAQRPDDAAQNTARRCSPRSRAASMSLSSIFAMTEYIGSTMYGK